MPVFSFNNFLGKKKGSGSYGPHNWIAVLFCSFRGFGYVVKGLAACKTSILLVDALLFFLAGYFRPWDYQDHFGVFLALVIKHRMNLMLELGAS